MRKRKMLLLIVLALVACIFFTGCGKKDKEEAQKEERVFQIQRLEGITMEDIEELPCKVKTYKKSTDAFNAPTTVAVDQALESVKMNFSFTSEEGEVLSSVKDGMVIETNETMPGVEAVNIVGDIATFQLQITPKAEQVTVVYELVMTKGSDKKSCNRFIAIRMIPKGDATAPETPEQEQTTEKEETAETETKTE